MDKDLRKSLRNVVTKCRKLLEEAIGELLQGQFGIHSDGRVEDASRLSHLSTDDLSYRGEVLTHLKHIQASGLKPKDAAAQLIREAAFTHLNRLCAYKMMSSRGLIEDPVGKALKSRGFLFYLADHPTDEALYHGAQQDVAYRHYFERLNESLSPEIGVLFAPEDLATRLFPPCRVLITVLDLINSPKLARIWAEDETIGWVYQYFTPKEDRDKAREKSRAPRNSNELAFRNQFFTPRYVVEFLADNTLGRIWYEMQQGETRLVGQCRFLIRKPNEKFLSLDERPNVGNDGTANLTQEDLLNTPDQIEYRPKKDPREIKILDPASGSGHFLIYCFDLLQTIYEEAYEDADLGGELTREYPDSEQFKRAIPSLILAHNLHGIDIDIRANQIAALALWMRAQREYHKLGLEPKARPRITRLNLVAAEPMPGESELLDEFVSNLKPRLLGQLVRVVFEKMRGVGEVGTLLKIEKEISDAISEAKRLWRAVPKMDQMTLFQKERIPEFEQGALFDVSDITDEQFWTEAEARVIESLRVYAQGVSNGKGLLRRLFADDAAQGFAFVDICRKRFDVVLMNPPFGAASKGSKSYIDLVYPKTKGDLLANFIERSLELSLSSGLIGAISSRTCFFLGSFASLRDEVLREKANVTYLADLGDGVLDAMVETAIYTLKHRKDPQEPSIFFRALLAKEKATALLASLATLKAGKLDENTSIIDTDEFSRLAGSPYAYWITSEIIKLLSEEPQLEGHQGKVRVGLQTSEDARFLRLVWEVPPSAIGAPSSSYSEDLANFVNDMRASFKQGKHWAFYSKTDYSAPWVSPLTLVVNWSKDGDSLREYARMKGDSPSRTIRSEELYFRPGFSYMLRSTRVVPYIVRAGVIPTAGRAQVYPLVGNEFSLLGYCASNVASAVARFSGEMFARPKFQASMIQNLPVPTLPASVISSLSERINSEVASRRKVIQSHEPFQEFTRPIWLNASPESSTAWNILTLVGSELDMEIARAFGLTPEQLKVLERDIREAVSLRESPPIEPEEEQDKEANDDDVIVELVDQSPRARAEGLISYCIGVTFGRWDVRIGKDETLSPRPQGVFDPLPICPPGTLVAPDGLPAESNRIVSEEWLRARVDPLSLLNKATISDDDYPIKIDWDGVLVDDPQHSDDIVTRARIALTELLSQDAEAIEQDICRIIGVKDLREYLRKSGKTGFWMDHVYRYSMNHRKAPIYWLLQSSKKNYAVWLYYHRLDRDILFKSLQRVTEKINQEELVLKDLVQDRNAIVTSGGSVKPFDKKIESQETLLSEIEDFRDKLKRAADLNLVPDLNDGVVLNIAPLWELVPWTEAKKYWKELTEGKYEWSSISKQLRERGMITK